MGSTPDPNLYRVDSPLHDQKAGPVLREAVRAHQSCACGPERIGRAVSFFKATTRLMPKSLLVNPQSARGQSHVIDYPPVPTGIALFASKSKPAPEKSPTTPSGETVAA